jgi:hypothetical protein
MSRLRRIIVPGISHHVTQRALTKGKLSGDR